MSAAHSAASSSHETMSQIAALTQQMTALTEHVAQTRHTQEVMGAFLQALVHPQQDPQAQILPPAGFHQLINQGTFPDYQEDETAQWFQMDVQDLETEDVGRL